MIDIRNQYLHITIKNAGAELTSIHHQQNGIDYLWNGNPQFWSKHSPVLFPFVGTLKDNTYIFEGKPYSLPRHGFARDSVFQPLAHNETSATFELRSDDETLANYPFRFSLKIHYALEDDKLIISYEVNNEGKGSMYFSIGGHPAFHLPLQKGLSFKDYFLEFDTEETLEKWVLSEGLLKTHTEPFLNGQKKVPLTHNLFANDAIVLKHPASKYISLKSNASKHGLKVKIENFPYLGIWSAPEAPFVCIEPWQGITDSLYHNQKLEEKEGIVALDEGKTWQQSWDITFW